MKTLRMAQKAGNPLRKLVYLVTVLVLAVMALPAANAADLQGTLKKIKDNGIVVVGYREASVPFSYYNNDKKPVGYSVEISKLIIQQIKKKLDMPNLKVRWLPITSQNRIILVQNGTFDFGCNSTTHNASRAKQAAFSNSFFIIGTRLMTKKGSGIKDFDDLKGKTVVVGAGTTSEVLLNKLNHKNHMGMSIISAKDHTQSFLTLTSGRADAMMMDDALLAGERAKAKNHQQWVITGTPQSHEVYACMMRKNDPQLKSLIDSVITRIETDGTLKGIYKKWFMSPIPPNGDNLDFPMSADMQALFAHPNDKVDPTL